MESQNILSPALGSQGPRMQFHGFAGICVADKYWADRIPAAVWQKIIVFWEANTQSDTLISLMSP